MGQTLDTLHAENLAGHKDKTRLTMHSSSSGLNLVQLVQRQHIFHTLCLLKNNKVFTTDIFQACMYCLKCYFDSWDLEKMLPSVLVDSTSASAGDIHV